MATLPHARILYLTALAAAFWLGSCASKPREQNAAGPTWRALCKASEPDLLPNSPILTTSILFADGRASGNEATEAMRVGFGQASYDVTPEVLSEGAILAASDNRRWTMVPLSDKAGPVTLVLAPIGTPACAAFEREIDAQRTPQNTADPMRFYTDRRLRPAPTGARNWCLASLEGRDPEAIVYRRTVELLNLPRAHVTRILETLEQPDADPRQPAKILARRIFLQKIALDEKGVETGVGKDCAGKPNMPQPAFVGQQGIALRPLNPPNLVTAPPATAG